MHLHVHGAHGHSHAGGEAHSHDLPGTGVMAGSVAVTLLLVAIELVGGILSGSIALVSDAVHNLSDVPTLVISWLGVRMAERPSDAQKTYGYHRAGILAAFANSILLILVAAFLFYEAWERFAHPAAVGTAAMIWISVAALAVNAGITLSVMRGRRDLNVRTVFIHNLGDALSNVAILAGGLVIRASGAHWIDPLLAVAIGTMVLWSSVGILRESSHILLEGLPRELELENVARAILTIPGVQEIHDVHIWTLGTNLNAMSCHVRIPDMHMEESERILAGIRRELAEKFQITHSTVQFERAGLPAETVFHMPEPR